MIQKNEAPSFEGLGIAINILAVLKENNFTHPTPIQHQVIPAAIEGKDIVGIAQTGTGKTLAFGIPVIQRLLATHKTALILLPTRELALQVNEVLEKIGKTLGVKTAVLIGGASIWKQKIRLQGKPDIVIATPGRLADHLKQNTYNLSRIKVVVLDEADRMLDIGFLPEINRILKLCPQDRQTMLFSATMPQEIAKVAANHMKLPLRIEVAPQGTASETIEQEMFIVNKNSKMQLLDKILNDTKGSTLVFSRTKHGAKKIARDVRAMGHSSAEIHSNRSLAQRIAALDGFKSGKIRVLVATDIAARGIDVSNISLVINFDLPECSEDYVHRIGRTGRAGKSGKAISFAAPDQKGNIKQIERLIRKTLPILALPILPPARVSDMADRPDRNSRGFSSGNRQRQGGNSRPQFRGRNSQERSQGRSERSNDRGFENRRPEGFRDRNAGAENRNTGGYRSRENSSESRPARNFESRNTRFENRQHSSEYKPSRGNFRDGNRSSRPARNFSTRQESTGGNVYQDDYSRFKNASASAVGTKMSHRDIKFKMINSAKKSEGRSFRDRKPNQGRSRSSQPRQSGWRGTAQNQGKFY